MSVSIPVARGRLRAQPRCESDLCRPELANVRLVWVHADKITFAM